MATGRKGQRYGTVGVDEGTTIFAWLDHDKKKAFKRLCAEQGITMSRSINGYISMCLANAGVPDQSVDLVRIV